jgi:hypothetical protein
MGKKGVNMCRVKARIVPGANSSERVAYIKTASGGKAEVILDVSQANHHSVVAAEIGRKDDRVLIELPRETSSGEWRVWVSKKQLVTR